MISRVRTQDILFEVIKFSVFSFIILWAGAPIPIPSPKTPEPDWTADDEEEDAEPKDPPIEVESDVEAIMANIGGKEGSGPGVADAATATEIYQRCIALLQEQRLQAQSSVNHQIGQKLSQEFTTKVLLTVLGAVPNDVIPMLDHVTPANILEIKDHNGLTVLHHACRLGLPSVTERVLQINKHLVDVLTFPDGKPPHWTSLMVLVDRWQDKPSYQQCMQHMLTACSSATYAMRAPTGQSPFHVAASRGQWWVMKQLCWGLYNAAGSDAAAFAMVESIINSPGGGRDAGVVDHAFRSNTKLALWLIKNWGGKALLSPPTPDQRGYTYAWRSQPFGK